MFADNVSRCRYTSMVCERGISVVENWLADACLNFWSELCRAACGRRNLRGNSGRKIAFPLTFQSRRERFPEAIAKCVGVKTYVVNRFCFDLPTKNLFSIPSRTTAWAQTRKEKTTKELVAALFDFFQASRSNSSHFIIGQLCVWVLIERISVIMSNWLFISTFACFVVVDSIFVFFFVVRRLGEENQASEFRWSKKKNLSKQSWKFCDGSDSGLAIVARLHTCKSFTRVNFELMLRVSLLSQISPQFRDCSSDGLPPWQS